MVDNRDKIIALLINVHKFINITLENNLYGITIYGHQDEQEYNLLYCIIEILFSKIYKKYKLAVTTNKDITKMINIINSFIIKFNENNNDNHIKQINSNLNEDGISNEQIQQTLNLIRNQKFMSVISNLDILPKTDDNIKTKKIASIKEYQEIFKKLKDEYSAP